MKNTPIVKSWRTRSNGVVVVVIPKYIREAMKLKDDTLFKITYRQNKIILESVNFA